MTYLHRVPSGVMKAAGALEEFAKDAAVVSIRLKSGQVFSPAVIVYPDSIAAIEGFDRLPFKEEEIAEVFQTAEDLKRRSSSSWTYLTK